MRRILIAAIVVLLAACSTPPVRLSPDHRVGAQRVYRLETTATTSLDVGGQRDTQTTVLTGRSTIEVVSIEGDETVLRLTLTPDRFTVDGDETPPPSEQRAELAVGPDGAVRRVVSVGGVPAELVATDIEDLAPLIGSPLPEGRVRVGERWERRIDPPAVQAQDGQPGARPAGPGLQRGRLAALRVVAGYDCAIVSLSTSRPLVRERAQGEQPLRLEGTEVSSTQIAFAFREGFPVRIDTSAEGRFHVAAGPVTGGEVVIVTETSLRLLDVTE